CFRPAARFLHSPQKGGILRRSACEHWLADAKRGRACRAEAPAEVGCLTIGSGCGCRGIDACCHAREGGHPVNPGLAAEYWVPAFAGTTTGMGDESRAQRAAIRRAARAGERRRALLGRGGV